PVIFAMLSNHYSFLYTHKQAWLVLFLMMMGGALIRQFFVQRHAFHHGRAGNPLPWAIVGCIVIAAVIVWMKPAPQAAAPAAAAPVPPAELAQKVAAVMEQRCTQCHNAQVQMKNVRLDSPEALKTHAQNVYQQVVVTRQMPMNNATQITEAERALVGDWFKAGAPVR
ncbi:MAG: urate hydroxylase PuuD, partial [Burkholderiaceae bacterium]